MHTNYYNYERKKAIKKYELPEYTNSFYPAEQEVTLKGGLLPHYMIGYYYEENRIKHFEVNPYFFEQLNYNWIKDGLPVNQDDFFEMRNGIQFYKGYSVNNQGDYQDVLF